ncbi:hypothetical protein BIW11_04799 [Tropilaelaps mercedesae]|uniref:Uncharacterized protein n=1 Tax=Tropilaelaps mercedesae TaxID=418985 RepID=A0A1V9X1D3_9ACAR|nr:hypothetical protein BIW11_04799 [Tropilaelaps mercedesae]
MKQGILGVPQPQQVTILRTDLTGLLEAPSDKSRGADRHLKRIGRFE